MQADDPAVCATFPLSQEAHDELLVLVVADAAVAVEPVADAAIAMADAAVAM